MNADISVQEIVGQYLQKINSQKHLNAFVEVFSDEAMLLAEQLDAKIKNKEPLGDLFGLVIGIKDVICYKNHKTTAASKMLADFTSVYNATAIQKLIDADAIIIGSLNCDEFAMGSANENSVFGPVLNADDNERIAGGSSGGSAVAVQADLCHASLGSDTGGSVRMPASYCGVIGMKPSYGVISRHGLIAYASSFDQIGVFTKHIDDAAKIINVIAGKDDFDSTVNQQDLPSLIPNNKQQQPYKLAVLNEVKNNESIDSEISNQFKNKIEVLENEGFEIEYVDFPYLKQIVSTYYILTAAEATSNLARYDGIHYGHRSNKAETLEETYVLSRSEALGTEVKKRIMLGNFILSAGYYDAYYSKAQKVRHLISKATKEIFEKADFIVSPTNICTAFKIGEKSDDPIALLLSDLFTVQANLVGIPAISLPLFKHSNGLSFGFQVMANQFEEKKLFQFSSYLMSQARNLQ